MRYVAIAALGATFWLLVATVRLFLHPPVSQIEASPAPKIVARAVPKPYFDDYQNNDIAVGPPQPVHPMSKTALVRGFNEMRPRVSACYAKYRVPGTAMANVVIAKSGRVSSAQVTGKFAGTPTGACVEAAVKTARFPPSDGFRTPYPFQLR